LVSIRLVNCYFPENQLGVEKGFLGSRVYNHHLRFPIGGVNKRSEVRAYEGFFAKAFALDDLPVEAKRLKLALCHSRSHYLAIIHLYPVCGTHMDLEGNYKCRKYVGACFLSRKKQ
jgi:hypothetical protein